MNPRAPALVMTQASDAAHGLWVSAALVVVAAFLIGGLTGLIRYDAVGLAQSASYIIVLVTVAFFSYVFGFGGLNSAERGRVIIIAVLIFAATVFWSGFEQAGSSLNLFAERYTVRDFGNFTVPATWFQSLNPAFILILAPLYSMLWLALANRKLDPNPVLKMAIGLIMLGLGFSVMIFSRRIGRTGRRGVADLAHLHVPAAYHG